MVHLFEKTINLLFLIVVLICVGKCPGVHGAPIVPPAPLLECWSGNSNPGSLDGYPPELEDCTLVSGGTTCQLTYVANLNLYSMRCSAVPICHRLLEDLKSGSVTSLYDEVKCCNTTGCNSYSNMPSSGSSYSPSFIPFVSILMLYVFRDTMAF